MAQRINITVPDGLHSRLERWRDRLNVSAICQEALEKEVSRLESIPSNIEDLDEIVTRLRRQKEEWEKESFEKGLGFGQDWARNAPYPQLKRLVNIRERYERSIAAGRMQDVPDVPTPFDLLEATLGEEWAFENDWKGVEKTGLLERYPSLRPMTREEWTPHGLHYLFLDTGDKNTFKRGWFEGLDSFWRSVKDMI